MNKQAQKVNQFGYSVAADKLKLAEESLNKGLNSATLHWAGYAEDLAGQAIKKIYDEAEVKAEVFRKIVERSGDIREIAERRQMGGNDGMESEASSLGIKKQALFVGSLNDIKDSSTKNEDMLRLSIIAELDAVNLYEQMAELTDNPKIKELMLDVAKEEKVHAGEFNAMLSIIDKEYVDKLEEGAGEVEDMGGKKEAMNILKNLIVIANGLDSKGLFKEADIVNNIINKIAQDEDYYDDSQRLDELSTMEDYNRYEEEQLAQDADREREEDEAREPDINDDLGTCEKCGGDLGGVGADRCHCLEEGLGNRQAHWLSRLTKTARCNHEDFPCCGCDKDEALSPEQARERMEAEDFEEPELYVDEADEMEDEVSKGEPWNSNQEGSRDPQKGEYYDSSTGDY